MDRVSEWPECFEDIVNLIVGWGCVLRDVRRRVGGRQFGERRLRRFRWLCCQRHRDCQSNADGGANADEAQVENEFAWVFLDNECIFGLAIQCSRCDCLSLHISTIAAQDQLPSQTMPATW